MVKSSILLVFDYGKNILLGIENAGKCRVLFSMKKRGIAVTFFMGLYQTTDNVLQRIPLR